MKMTNVSAAPNAATWLYPRNRRRDSVVRKEIRNWFAGFLLMCAGLPSHAGAAGFAYQDSDLLLVLRKAANNDMLFNLGSVSNYLGWAAGTTFPVTNWDAVSAQVNFAGNLAGVKYVLLAATPVLNPNTGDRVWLSDSDPATAPTDETFSRWSSQRSVINAVGTRATAYATAINQSLVLPPSDPAAYTYIASSGGTLDVSTMGGAAPFTVEQDVPGATRFFELKVSAANPKPAAVRVGSFQLTAEGALTFTAGVPTPLIATPPSSQAVWTGGSLVLSVSATGSGNLSYQWYRDTNLLPGATNATLTLASVGLADAGTYTVMVTNGDGGSVTSTGAIVTVASTPASTTAFSYQDTDLLLVFRKTGHNDVLFNLGSVSHYLGLVTGTVVPVTNWYFDLVRSNFAGDLSGVTYVLMATTPVLSPNTGDRVWLSNADPAINPADETFSRWSSQRSVINGVGSRAAAYPTAINQALVLPSSDPASYTYVASGGGTLDVTTMGGAAPFTVEHEVPGTARFFELKVGAAGLKPDAVQVGSFNLAIDGTLTFTAGVPAPIIEVSPASQTVQVGGSVVLGVSASGSGNLAYQWYRGATRLASATNATLTLSRVSLGDAGDYTVVVANAGGTATSRAATLTVLDTIIPGSLAVSLVVGTNTYAEFAPNLAPGTKVYLDTDPLAGSAIRATQRSLGYREVDYKQLFFRTLYFNAVTPATNQGIVTYDYSAQAATSTNLVGYWTGKDLPVLIGPDGNAYITDGHHTTAGYLGSNSPVQSIVAGKKRVVIGHIVANYYSALTGPQAVNDAWWQARQAENNAFLYGTNGDQLVLPGEAGYSGLQPILPSALAMPITPSNVGAAAMANDVYRSLTWGLADGVVKSATDAAGKKIAGYSKKGLSGADVNFVEFYWADYLRGRVIWNNNLAGSPLSSTHGDRNVIQAPLSFFTAVANGIALGKSEAYRDQFGRGIKDYASSTLFSSNVAYWAISTLTNGLAAPSNTFHLYLRDDSGIAGDITPSAYATNVLHIDTVAGLSVTQAVKNISSLFVNLGGQLATSWKDATVSNSILTLPPGSGEVLIPGGLTVSGATVVGQGRLRVSGTLSSGGLTVAGGALQGYGVINGPVTIASGGWLEPGASQSTLIIRGALKLAGTTVMQISKLGTTIVSDRIAGLASIQYGGILIVAANSGALANGDSFQLFDAQRFEGEFAWLELPVLASGLAWDTSLLAVNGTLRVGGAPAGLSGLASQRSVLGGTAVFSVSATGADLNYQWYHNETPISGFNGPTLVISNVTTNQLGQYRVVVSNDGGSISSAVVTLSINRPPVTHANGAATTHDRALTLTPAYVLRRDSDPDGDALTIVSVNSPGDSGGTVTLTGGNVVYTPPAGFTGIDTFDYTVSDGFGGSAIGTMVIYVSDQPVPAPQQLAFTRSASGSTLRFSGDPGRVYEWQWSVDLKAWQTLGRVTAPADGLIDYQRLETEPQAFYRVVPQ